MYEWQGLMFADIEGAGTIVVQKVLLEFLPIVVVAPMELLGLVSSASSIAGNLFEMIPRSTHASVLRINLSVLLVT